MDAQCVPDVESSNAPLLLVSVRDAEEAREALDGGAEILDVKEPARGSLGMAALSRIGRVAEVAPVHVPVTAALGELLDWPNLAEIPALPTLAYVKLGLAGMVQRPDWQADWLRVRSRFEEPTARPPGWVAVAYADAACAGSPHVEEVINAAVTTGCRGVLIDTFSKSAGPLLAHVAIDELTCFAERVHDAGLFLALAGRLSVDVLPRLHQVPADIVAIRSAACDGSDRSGRVLAGCVAAFKRRLECEFSHAEDRRHWRRRAGAP
jgi:uncharacterized protein (UPF0264 family)